MSDDGKIHSFNIKVKAGPREQIVQAFERILASQHHLSVQFAKEEGRLEILKEMAPQAVWDEVKKMMFAVAHGLVENMTPNQFHGVATEDQQDNPHGFKFPELLDEALTKVVTRIKQAMESGVPLNEATKKITDEIGFDTDTSDVLGEHIQRAKKVEEQDGKLESGDSVNED